MSDEPGTELVLAHTGEIINLADQREVAAAYKMVATLDAQLYNAKVKLREALGQHGKLLGTKTLHVDGIGTFEIKKSEEKKYDALEIARELRDLGCPEETVNEIVVKKTTYTVDAVRASRAARANPAYAHVIEKHTTVIEKIPTIGIS